MNVCKRCGGREWLCEAHPDQPFEHEIGGEVCAGPGDPCPECNPLVTDEVQVLAIHILGEWYDVSRVSRDVYRRAADLGHLAEQKFGRRVPSNAVWYDKVVAWLKSQGVEQTN